MLYGRFLSLYILLVESSALECRKYIMNLALDLLQLTIAWCYVLLSPYTKVEESFNLHATHDVFFYGVRPAALANVRCLGLCLNKI